MLFGYIRVSSASQNLSRQMEKMLSLGIQEKNIYFDVKSGKDFDREAYKNLKRALRKEDVLFVDSLDRLGRNYDGVIKEWKEITRDIQADIVVLDNEELFDSRKFKAMGDIAKLMEDQLLAVLAHVAEQRRNEIKRQQREGIESAKRQGIKFGRQKKECSNFEEIYYRWKKDELTGVEATKLSGLSKSVFYRRIKELEVKYKIDTLEQYQTYATNLQIYPKQSMKTMILFI